MSYVFYDFIIEIFSVDFKREIETLRTLNVCEGIVKLRDSSTELYPFADNECYGGVLMDYVPGETLDHINWNRYTQLKKYEICAFIPV